MLGITVFGLSAAWMLSDMGTYNDFGWVVVMAVGCILAAIPKREKV